MHNSMMSYHDRYNARERRMNDIKNLGMDYVMERDKILKSRGLDPLLSAENYEKNRRRDQIRVKFEPDPLLLVEKAKSEYGGKVEDMLKTKSVDQVVEKFIESYSEDDYPPMFQELACQDEQNIEMQKLSALFEKECQLLAVDFLKRHSDKVSSKALIGFAHANVCESTFNRMFSESS
jgi:hypothetical protein